MMMQKDMAAVLALALLTCNFPAFSSDSTAAHSTAQLLETLVFEPEGDWLRANQRFSSIEQCNFYTEGEDTYNVLGSSPYLYDVSNESEPKVPPMGLRSAIPLGGLGTGSVELRADGSFHDWLVENGGPGLNEYGKIALKEEMLLGLRVNGVSKVLSTHAPNGLPSVAGLRYSGAFPVSRLEVDDEALPVDATLYAYSSFEPWDARASAVPSITFSLLLHNPSPSPANASFAMLLPLLQEKDQSRTRQMSGVVVDTHPPNPPPPHTHLPHASQPPPAGPGRQGWLTISAPDSEISASELIGCSISSPAGWSASPSSRKWRARIRQARHSSHSPHSASPSPRGQLDLLWEADAPHFAQANQSTVYIQVILLVYIVYL